MLYTAYLVESKRIDGKPRQRTIYLASIRDTQIENPHQRLQFWQSVQKKIQALCLAQEQLHTIKAQLLQRIPDVTKEQIEEAEKKWEEALAQLHARLKARM